MLKGYVLPWYYRAFLPRYNQYLPLKPYTALAKVHARNAQVYVHKNIIHPGQVQPTLALVYSKAQPAIFGPPSSKQMSSRKLVWQQSRPYALKAVKYAEEGGKARRTYVDPHVRKILDKVSSETSARAEKTRNPVEEELYDDAGFQVLEALQAEPTSVTSDEPTPTESTLKAPIEVGVTPTTPDAADSVPPTASPVENVDEVTSFSEPATTISSEEAEALTIAVSVAEQSAEGATGTVDVDAAIAEPSGPAHDVEEAVKEKIAHIVVDEKKVEEERLTTASQTLTGAPASETPAQEDDLDDFLSDLGIDADTEIVHEHAEEAAQALQDAYDAHTQQPLEPVEDVIPEFTEEELAERKKQETAAKRTRILRRHQEWEEKIAKLVEDQKVKVGEDVDEVRSSAAAELVEKGGLGKTKMGSIEKQGEKLVKGLEAYLTKVEQRSDKWKSGEDEQVRKDRSGKEKDKWEEVVAKVDARFDAVVKGVQGEVHEWYVGIRTKEGGVAVEAAAPIKHLAESAQADLAMDYAWLDDVTYQDWQNYHDLVRTYEAFEQEAAGAIQSSTAAPGTPTPSWLTLSSPDPLIVALDDLQRELDDIRRAAGILAISESEAESGGTFSIKRERGELVDDMRGAETATILPVSPPAPGTGKGSGSEEEQRSKVQVEEAIGRAVGEL
ncbi:hypothetical protein FA13DRAFT_1748551 [Coprinellus micaceus]|uniref:Uncharacterized protein n=1 Tax=Coprinellus micaceus TaxID=71717 RepID=A0A4Y7RU44_COPMI|nr:hypothetical protein FA13DRAFT_1748551 [Coprinellus micaceus]